MPSSGIIIFGCVITFWKGEGLSFSGKIITFCEQLLSERSTLSGGCFLQELFLLVVSTFWGRGSLLFRGVVSFIIVITFVERGIETFGMLRLLVVVITFGGSLLLGSSYTSDLEVTTFWREKEEISSSS